MGDIKRDIIVNYNTSSEHVGVEVLIINLSGFGAAMYNAILDSHFGSLVFEWDVAPKLLLRLYHDTKTVAYTFDYVDEVYQIKGRDPRYEKYDELITSITKVIEDNKCDLVWIRLDLTEFQRLSKECME